MKTNELQRESRLFLINGSAMLGGYLLKRTIDLAYEKSFGKKAPKHLDQRNAGWGRVIAYAAITGALVSVLKLYIKKGVRDEID